MTDLDAEIASLRVDRDEQAGKFASAMAMLREVQAERDSYREQYLSTAQESLRRWDSMNEVARERDAARAVAAEILAAYESGTVVSDELTGIWRERAGLEGR